MHSRRLTTVVSIFVAVILLAPADLAAQEDSEKSRAERADDFYTEAVRLMSNGRYREAVDEFTRAIELDDSPVYHCNRGVAFIKLAEWDAAIEDLRICRDGYNAAPGEMAQIDAQLKAVETMDRAVRPKSIETAQDIAAGDVEPQTVTEVKVVEEEDSPWDSELIGHLALGTGAVMWTAALTLDFLSADLREDFEAQSAGGPATSPERYDKLRKELKTRQKVFYGLGIAGTAFAATGVSLLVYNWFLADPERPSTAQPTLSITPRSRGAALQLRFKF